EKVSVCDRLVSLVFSSIRSTDVTTDCVSVLTIGSRKKICWLIVSPVCRFSWGRGQVTTSGSDALAGGVVVQTSGSADSTVEPAGRVTTMMGLVSVALLSFVHEAV